MAAVEASRSFVWATQESLIPPKYAYSPPPMRALKSCPNTKPGGASHLEGVISNKCTEIFYWCPPPPPRGVPLVQRPAEYKIPGGLMGQAKGPKGQKARLVRQRGGSVTSEGGGVLHGGGGRVIVSPKSARRAANRVLFQGPKRGFDWATWGHPRTAPPKSPPGNVAPGTGGPVWDLGPKLGSNQGLKPK